MAYPILWQFVSQVSAGLFDARFIAELFLIIDLIERHGCDVKHAIDLIVADDRRQLSVEHLIGTQSGNTWALSIPWLMT